MLGAVSPDSFDTLHSYSNTFQMPFVTPWFPEKVSTVRIRERTADNNEKMSYVIDFVCSYLHLMWLPFSPESETETESSRVLLLDCFRRQSIN